MLCFDLLTKLVRIILMDGDKYRKKKKDIVMYVFVLTESHLLPNRH